MLRSMAGMLPRAGNSSRSMRSLRFFGRPSAVSSRLAVRLPRKAASSSRWSGRIASAMRSGVPMKTVTGSSPAIKSSARKSSPESTACTSSLARKERRLSRLKNTLLRVFSCQVFQTRPIMPAAQGCGLGTGRPAMRSFSSAWKCPSVGSRERRAVTRRAVATSAAASFQTVSPELTWRSGLISMWASAWVSVTISGPVLTASRGLKRAERGLVASIVNTLPTCARIGPQTEASSPLKSRTSANSVQVRSVGTMLLTPLPVRVGPRTSPCTSPVE